MLVLPYVVAAPLPNQRSYGQRSDIVWGCGDGVEGNGLRLFNVAQYQLS